MNDSMRQADHKYLWHPYTDIEWFEKEAPYTIFERAEGVYLYTDDGRKLMDGIASWWCVNLGHSHPKIVKAIQDQAATMQHCILGGVSHPNAVKLAEKLAKLAPGDLGHAFFCGDGASAVEVSLKIAVQYWWNIGRPEKTRFITIAEGYHGDTLGAVGVGFVESFHQPFAKVINPAYRALSPHCNRCPMGKEPKTCSIECFESMDALIREHAHEAAAVILEPLVQGAGGIRIYPDEYLRKLRSLCDECGVLLICDEIAVGFGRMGTLFASGRAGIVPDLMTIGKGMTGGYMPMSAALATDKIYDSFRNDADSRANRNRTLFHGHTYTGNPVTSACALAALEVYEEEKIFEQLPAKVEQLAKGMDKIAAHFPHSKMLTTGMVGMVEIEAGDGGAARARAVTDRANALGLLIRPLGDVLYLWPPLTATEAELGAMIGLFAQAAEETVG